MKVKIENREETKDFRPYSVTFFIDTEEESTIFHDEVAIQFPDAETFIESIYDRCDGKYTPNQDIEI